MDVSRTGPQNINLSILEHIKVSKDGMGSNAGQREARKHPE
jgi:hypothetical protein